MAKKKSKKTEKKAKQPSAGQLAYKGLCQAIGEANGKLNHKISEAKANYSVTSSSVDFTKVSTLEEAQKLFNGILGGFPESI